jgi:outer membrane protein assembly factor BamB
VDATQNDIPSNVYCLNASTGEKVWNYTMKGGASYSSPALTGGLLYMGDWANNVYCLDALTGTEKWVYTTQNHVNSSPAIADGIVYVASWDHTIYAFGAQSTITPPSSFALSSESTLLIGIAVSVGVIIAAILVLRRRKK